MPCSCCCLLLPFAHAAVSEEQVQSVGGSSLTDAMPNSARQYLDGVSPENADTLSDSVSRVLENMTSDSQSAIRTALGGLLRVAVIVLLASAARGFSAAAGGEANDWIDMAAALGCAAVLLRDFTGVLSLCRDTLDQISVFSGTLQPVLATVLATGGNTATATVLQAATMVVFDLVIRLVNALLVPAACAYLAITAVDAAAGNGMLRGIADGIKSLTSGVLKLILTLFTAYLAIAGGVSGNVDRMTLKTAKLAVSGAVPVVGGVISDATETMLSGASFAARLDRHFRDAVCSGYLLCAVRSSGSKLFVLQGGGCRTLAAVLGRHEAVPRKRRHRLWSAARHAEHLLYDFIPRTRVYGGDGETNMTELLQTILLRVTIAGAVSAMALKLAGGGALKEVVRTAAGLLMLLALLQPLAGLHMLSWNWQGSVSQRDIDEMQARNMQTTMSTVAASIAKAVQQRAEEAGIPCTVNVEMANDADGLLQVDKVTVYYDSTAANRLSELQSLLTKECGVPAERQELIAR